MEVAAHKSNSWKYIKT